MMSYWGSRDVSVDNIIDGYDSTPYSGGYDLSLTYGRPLKPSDEICYPVSSTGHFDLERPHYSSDSHTSAFETHQKNDCYGLLQLHPQPLSNTRYPGYGSDYYGHQEFRSEYGSGYAREGLKHYGANEYPRSEDDVGGYRRNNDCAYYYGGNTSYYDIGEEGNNKSIYGDDYPSTGYRKPSYYGGEHGEGFGHSKYGNDSDDVEKNHSHQKHHHRHY